MGANLFLFYKVPRGDTSSINAADGFAHSQTALGSSGAAAPSRGRLIIKGAVKPNIVAASARNASANKHMETG